MAGDPRRLEPYIRETAQKYGIDPDTAMRVAHSEGLNNPVGDHGKSHGAFQLYTGGGVGNAFQRDTGLNPADPANERATIDYALKTAAHGGWGPWNGAKAQGILGMQGINGQMAEKKQDTPPLNPDAKVAPPAGGQPAPAPATTTSMNNPLAGMTSASPQAAPMHSNEGVNTALTNAFRPIVPDAINGLLGSQMGQLQAQAGILPISYYQPRQPAKV